MRFAAMANIFLLEDDKILSKGISIALKKDEHMVTAVYGYLEALKQYQKQNLYVYRQGKTHIVSVIHEIYGSISYVVPAAHHTVKINGIRNWTEKPLTVINATISLTTELNGKELKSV